MLTACIYGGIRTPFGRYGGELSSFRPDDMAALVLAELAKCGPFPLDLVEDVVLGCSNQGGEDCRNIGRNAALLAGFPVGVTGQTVNRLCASGLAAVWDAARALTAGEGELYIAGGVESMSRAPLVMGKAQGPFDRAIRLFDSTIGSRFPNERFVKQFGDDSLAQTADNIAAEEGITREESDAFAYRSQSLYAKARVEGYFDAEILPVVVPAHKKDSAREVRKDEHPRPDVSLESLAVLPSLNHGGVTTAGNASGINDGAAALWIGSPALGKKKNISPLVHIKAAAVSGVAPRVMGLGPVGAITKALQRAGLSLKDMSLIEINEAFAAQVLGCLKQLGLSYEDERINPVGGAISMGHPLGASGARIALTASRFMRKNKLRYGVISLCIGLGQGMAMILENPEGR